MEIRANFILIGAFSLLSILGILYVILLLSASPTDHSVDEYRIHFSDSVSGLSIGNAVLFSGIKVGQVKDITLSETLPGAVEVIIQVRGDTPVRANSQASLEMMGLTGASAVAITGGSADSPILNPVDGQLTEILSKPSPLKEVMDNAPNTVTMINEVLVNLEKITGKENEQSVTTILESMAQITSVLAKEKDHVAGLVREGHAAAAELNTLLRSANKMVSNLDSVLTALSPELRKVSSDSLPQLRSLITEARVMVQVITRIGHKIDSDPRHFMFGNSIQEYDPQ